MNPQIDFGAFASASDKELMSVIGMYALPLVQEPSETLRVGRQGGFWQDGSTALGEEFQHSRFEQVGREFLRRWAFELGNAVCGNDELYTQVKARGLTQLGVTAGLISGAIAHAVPALAPYTGLLAVLGAFIAQTGLRTFCQMLKEMQSPGKPS